MSTGGGEAVRAGRSDVRWMSGCSLRRKVCPFFLCQCHLSAVLLRVLLGEHPLTRRPRVPQTAGEGGRRSTSACVLPLELMASGTSPSPPTQHHQHHDQEPHTDLLSHLLFLENKYHGISVHYILCLQTLRKIWILSPRAQTLHFGTNSRC